MSNSPIHLLPSKTATQERLTTHLREVRFAVVKHEPIPDAKAERDPGKEGQEVKSRMDDDGSPIVDTVPDATGYSGSDEEN